MQIILPNATFIIEVLVFLLMLVILGKWGYPPIIAAAEGRQKMIEENIESAEKLKAEAEQGRADAQKAIDTAKADAQEILSRAQKEASAEIREAKEQGKAEVARMKKDGEADIANERKRAFQDAQKDVADLVVQVASRVIPSGIDVSNHKRLIEETIGVVHRGQGQSA